MTTPDPKPASFGEALMGARTRRRLRREQLAVAAGLSTSGYRKFELSTTFSGRPEFLAAILNVLDGVEPLSSAERLALETPLGPAARRLREAAVGVSGALSSLARTAASMPAFRESSLALYALMDRAVAAAGRDRIVGLLEGIIAASADRPPPPGAIKYRTPDGLDVYAPVNPPAVAAPAPKLKPRRSHPA